MVMFAVLIAVVAAAALIGAVLFGFFRNRKAPESSTSKKSHGSSATR